MGLIRRAAAGVAHVHARFVAPSNDEPERGDVPGWVMITLMTAVLVVVIWGIASDSLQGLLKNAFQQVTDKGGGQ